MRTRRGDKKKSFSSKFSKIRGGGFRTIRGVKYFRRLIILFAPFLFFLLRAATAAIPDAPQLNRNRQEAGSRKVLSNATSKKKIGVLSFVVPFPSGAPAGHIRSAVRRSLWSLRVAHTPP